MRSCSGLAASPARFWSNGSVDGMSADEEVGATLVQRLLAYSIGVCYLDKSLIIHPQNVNLIVAGT